MKIAKIYIDQKNRRLDRPFDYLVPDHARPGCRTVQRFSQGEKLTKGFIFSIEESSEYENSLKAIEALIDEEPVLTEDQIKLCLWIKQSYFTLFWEALSLFTSWSPLLKKKDGIEAYHLPEIRWLKLMKEYEGQPGNVQEKIISALRDGDMSYEELREKIPNLLASLKGLMEKGVVGAYRKKNPLLIPEDVEEDLFFERMETFEPLDYPEDEGIFYLEGGTFQEELRNVERLYYDLSEEGRSLLIITPDKEILSRVQSYFDHLGMKPQILSKESGKAQRNAVAQNLREGRGTLFITTPAGLFLPFSEFPPALAVMETGSYNYHLPGKVSLSAIDLAERLHKETKCPLFFFDRIGSVISRKKLEEGEWCSLEKAQEKSKGAVIMHMDKELREGNRSILSRFLKEAMLKALNEGKKVFLLLNRTGYARHVFCRSCGYTFTCPKCGMPMQARRGSELLYCPSCATQIRKPERCPECGSQAVKENGLGIEKAVEIIGNEFNDSIVSLYPDLSGEIIVGTSALNHIENYDQVGCAAALLADLDLNFPDYAAREQAVRMYTRFFARAQEEANCPKEQCILQTYEREDESLRAIAGEREKFFAEEQKSRSLSGLPPYGTNYVFSLRGRDREVTSRETVLFRRRLQNAAQKEQVKASFLKIFQVRNMNGACRFIVKSDDVRFKELVKKFYEEGEVESLISKVSIRIDPPTLV